MVTILNPWGVTDSLWCRQRPGCLESLDERADGKWRFHAFYGTDVRGLLQHNGDFHAVKLEFGKCWSQWHNGFFRIDFCIYRQYKYRRQTVTADSTHRRRHKLLLRLTNSSLLGLNYNLSNLHSVSINNNSNLLTSNTDSSTTPLNSTDNVVTVSYAPQAAVQAGNQAKQVACQTETNTAVTNTRVNV